MNKDWELEEWVEKIALMPIRWFYPTFPAKDLDLSLPETTQSLMVLVQRGWLELLWEVRCPECFTSTISSGRCPEFGQETECEKCLNVFIVDESTLCPVFKVTQEYRARIAKKNNKAVPRPFQAAYRKLAIPF